jgi:hypothetical protein
MPETFVQFFDRLLALHKFLQHPSCKCSEGIWERGAGRQFSPPTIDIQKIVEGLVFPPVDNKSSGGTCQLPGGFLRKVEIFADDLESIQRRR